MSTPEQRRLADTLSRVDNDTASKVMEWVGWLETERRASRHTMDAYQRDMRACEFLSDHVGATLTRDHLEPVVARYARLAQLRERRRQVAGFDRPCVVGCAVLLPLDRASGLHGK